MSVFRTTSLCLMALMILSACSAAPKSSKPQEVPKSSQPQDAPKSGQPQDVLKPGKLQDVPKSGKPQGANKGGALYSMGITNYEEGEYDLAEKNLKSALTLGLADPGDKIKAHKYLAFLYCVSGRHTLCQNEFKKAFDIDPGFTLSPAEIGHPIWQPVYDKVKSRMTPAKKK